MDTVLDLTHWVTREEGRKLWTSRPDRSDLGFSLEDLARELKDHPDLEAGVDAAVLDALRLTQAGLESRVESHNDRFSRQEATDCASFFRTVERSPLNQEQVESCICFEHRVLAIAAAGSGKTSTMIAKAGYSMMRGIATGDEILMLAFNSDAAVELRQRVAERLGPLASGAAGVNASTFHKLGLEIIGKATGRKPRVAPWLEDGRDVDVVAEIISDLRDSSLIFRSTLAVFRMVLDKDLPAFEEEPEPEDWESATSLTGFRTIRGELVKSQEERLIADWLFYNGVEYEYEREYEFDTVTPDRGQYRPDFFYPDAGAYHEHFALDETGRPPERFGEQYLDGVRWKRAIHEEHGTKLLETTSFGLRNGDDLERLKAQLEELGVRFDPDPDREIHGRTPPSYWEIARKFRAFLIHAKNNRLSVDEIRSRLSTLGHQSFQLRRTAFMFLYEKISAEWDRRLRSSEYVDFEDMLNLATELVDSGKWESPFRLVMIDEFQDVSRSRADLARALVSREGSFLFAVGDDWQAINRFAGADVSFMSHFEETFGPARRLRLQETFRSPQLLCDIARDFVSRNPAQIRKQVISSQPVFGAPVQVYFCDDASREALLEKHLQVLHDKVGSVDHPARADGTVSILLLGRYNRDLPTRLKQWRDGFGDRMRIEFSTIHSSKGLEADYVFILRMSSGRYSFPSTIEDDPILLLAMPDSDDFRFAEERRLFYVALTRARRMVVVYCDEKMPSVFVDELQGDSRVLFAGGAKRRCPSCKKGSLVLREGPYSTFLGCSQFPRCRYTAQIPQVASSSA